jgi:uncharacterized protein YfaS (alpha-2-macroglobulin family)
MPQNTQGNLALTRNAAKGKLYYSVSLRYYVPGEAIQARSEGLAITRSYHSVTGSDAIREVRAGEVVRVRLQVVVLQTAYYVMVTDPLPAGLEGVNDTLNTTSFTERPPDPRGRAEDGYGSGRDYDYCPRCYRWGPFDNVEMRDDRTVLFATYMAPGTYVYEYFARATTPGTYMALPARAELMYYPDIFGHGEGGTFTVKQP